MSRSRLINPFVVILKDDNESIEVVNEEGGIVSYESYASRFIQSANLVQLIRF